MKKLTTTFVIAAVLLNAMAPTLAHAATYLQGTEVNANTLVKDAYVQVTYYDGKGKQKLEKGWIDAVGETTFKIRGRALFGKTTIAYDKVVSVIMSDESTTPTKQIREVDRFMRKRVVGQAEQDRLQAAIQTFNHKPITVMVRGQIDSSKITKGWYAHVVHTSQEITGGRVVNKTASGIIMLQHKQQDGKIAYNNINIAQNNIAYDNIDTLLVAQNMRDIERYRELGAKYNARVRFKAPSIAKSRIIGTLVKVRQDTLIFEGPLQTFIGFGRRSGLVDVAADTLMTPDGRTFFQVPRSEISNLEVGVGKRRNLGKGMAIGLGVGTGICGAVYAFADLDLDNPDSTDGLALLYVLGYISIPICVLSTLIGAATKSDKWVEVPPQLLNLSLAPTSSKGLRAALTFNF